MMAGYTWCWVRCVTGAWLRIEQGFVRGKNEMGNEQLETGNIAGERTCWRNRRVWLIGQNGTIAGAMHSPRLVKQVLNTLGKQLVDDGRLDSVSLHSAGPTADFPELDTQEWQEDDHDLQRNLLDAVKVKEGKREEIDWELKQKHFELRSRKRMRGTARPTSITEMGSEEQGRQGQSTTGCEKNPESQI